MIVYFISLFFEVSFYCEDQLVMTACRGITLGSLRSLYNAQLGNNYITLLGVKPKGDFSQMIVSAQDAYLNEDEYELILSGIKIIGLIILCCNVGNSCSF